MKELLQRIRLRSGLGVALLLLGLVEFGMARQEWLWDFEPRSNSGIVDVLEDDVIEAAEDPRVVIMGSSRIRDAVAPRLAEDMLGLPTGSVLNLGLTGGTAFDAVKLYERNRAKLSQADVVVLAVEMGNFLADPVPSPRVRRFATFEERLAWEGESRASLIIGYFWRTYDARGQLTALADRIIRGQSTEAPIAEDGRVVWRDPEAENPSEVDSGAFADLFFAGRAVGEGYLPYVESLVSYLRADGVALVLVHVPTSDEYADVVAANYPLISENFTEVLSQLEGVRAIDHKERASHVPGLEDSHFYDYGHLTDEGAVLTTRYYAGFLADTFPRLFADPG